MDQTRSEKRADFLRVHVLRGRGLISSIRIRILGSAAGGGLPQWNCSCPNCVAARTGKIPCQTQSSIALSGGDSQAWFLINASPDLSSQIEATPALQPQVDSPRNTPIAGVLLTNADIDHALGLVLMRNANAPLAVYGSKQMRQQLGWMNGVLDRFCGIEWKLDGLRPSSLTNGIVIRMIELGQSVAYHVRGEANGPGALIAPAVAEITDELREAAEQSDVVLFDGTFWEDDELKSFRPGARTAREMNHLPVRDSLDFLRKLPARRKVYTHINNTNPILMPGSPERAEVEQAGIEIGYDGMEIEL